MSRTQERGVVSISICFLLLLSGVGLVLGHFYQQRTPKSIASNIYSQTYKPENVSRHPVNGTEEKVPVTTTGTMRSDSPKTAATAKSAIAEKTRSGVAEEVDSDTSQDVRVLAVSGPTILDTADKTTTKLLVDIPPGTLSKGNLSEHIRQWQTMVARAPKDATLDMLARRIRPHAYGVALDVEATIQSLSLARDAGLSQANLVTQAMAPSVTTQSLGIDDISHVLGHFETKFQQKKESRSYNLKLAASRINGLILQPGDEFSFNEVVGTRTEADGYKIAGVILAGQMVDGIAGGSCQISTTLHGAAFFSGLDITDQTPHSRPSTYATAGMDATVVDGLVDLKLKNNYDFPIAIHFVVANNRSKVEILGKPRPYDKVTFERKITSRIPFDSVTREDGNMPFGSMAVDQPGYPGYKIVRYRHFHKDGNIVKTDKWKIRYRPVTEYVRVGANPNPNLPVPRSKKKRNLATVHGSGRMSQ